MLDPTPIFVHAWWRSSSTYVWLKLRENPSLCCYYEPLHEMLASLNKELATKGLKPEFSRAMRHPVPERNYYSEYFELPTSSVHLYSPKLAYDRYLLRASDSDPALLAYLSGLMTSALQAGRRPVLCFCRSQMRSAWMKRQFGGIHIAQIRNPISQWSSFLIGPYFTRTMIGLGLKLLRAYPGAFAHIHGFDERARAFDENPGGAPPLTVSAADALRLFLLLWIASSLQAVAQADRVIDVDLLSTDASYRAALSQWFETIGCAVDFSDCATPGAEAPQWGADLRLLIDEAVHAIRTHAACLVSEDPDAIRSRLPQLSPSNRAILQGVIGP